MTLFQHSRTSRWLTLATALLWVAAVASADVVLTPGMHCRDMPCCPRSDGGVQSCSTAQCAEQTPERAENQSAGKEPSTDLRAAAMLPREVAGEAHEAGRRELTPGLQSSTAVFRLKDDLRI
ncbi:MAG TPA: hypothetical protein VFE06_01250 [Acidobacteriaceae bacterium]|nr:hypothetical protein [Acidobacteriaceae bacterium]